MYGRLHVRKNGKFLQENCRLSLVILHFSRSLNDSHEYSVFGVYFFSATIKKLVKTSVKMESFYSFTLQKSLNVSISKILIGGELLRSKEGGGKTSSQYFIKYLSRLVKFMLKMYRKLPDASFALFLMIKMIKHCLA